MHGIEQGYRIGIRAINGKVLIQGRYDECVLAEQVLNIRPVQRQQYIDRVGGTDGLQPCKAGRVEREERSGQGWFRWRLVGRCIFLTGLDSIDRKCFLFPGLFPWLFALLENHQQDEQKKDPGYLFLAHPVTQTIGAGDCLLNF